MLALGWVLAKSWVRFRQEGELPRRGPAVLAPNHTSFLDPPLTFLALRRRPRTLITERVHRMFPAFYRFARTIPVRRSGINRQALALARQALEEGELLGIFPEGTVDPEGRLRYPQPGIGAIVETTDAPVYPMAFFGTFHSQPRGRKLPRPGRVILRVGRPLRMSELDCPPGTPRRERQRLFSEQVIGAIAQLLGVEAPKPAKPFIPVFGAGGRWADWPPREAASFFHKKTISPQT